MLTTEDRVNLDWHGTKIVNWFDHVLSLTHEGKHPSCQKEWLADTLDMFSDVLYDLTNGRLGSRESWWEIHAALLA